MSEEKKKRNLVCERSSLSKSKHPFATGNKDIGDRGQPAISNGPREPLTVLPSVAVQVY